jgi:hypothetical protein
VFEQYVFVDDECAHRRVTLPARIFFFSFKSMACC